MTKENLRDLFCKQLNSSQHWGDLSIFDEFFESNVVIPRGAIIECNIANTWYDTDLYRIKPSEPVYEWQWYYFKDTNVYIYMQNNMDGFNQYFTELEVPCYCTRFTESKRERR